MGDNDEVDSGPRFGPVGGGSGGAEPFVTLPAEKQPKPKVSPWPERDEWTLPERYGTDAVVALVRDPWWVFVYWELSDDTRAKAREKAGAGARMVLRMLDTGPAATVLAETRVPDLAAGDWYVNVTGPGLKVKAVIGYVGGDGAFHSVFASEERRIPTFAPGTPPSVPPDRASQVDEIFDYAGGPELSDRASLGDELRDGGGGPFVWVRGGMFTSGSGVGMMHRIRPPQPSPRPKGPPTSPIGPVAGGSGEGKKP